MACRWISLWRHQHQWCASFKYGGGSGMGGHIGYHRSDPRKRYEKKWKPLPLSPLFPSFPSPCCPAPKTQGHEVEVMGVLLPLRHIMLWKVVHDGSKMAAFKLSDTPSVKHKLFLFLFSMPLWRSDTVICTHRQNQASNPSNLLSAHSKVWIYELCSFIIASASCQTTPVGSSSFSLWCGVLVYPIVFHRSFTSAVWRQSALAKNGLRRTLGKASFGRARFRSC